MNTRTVEASSGAYDLTIHEKLDLILHRLASLMNRLDQTAREVREIRLRACESAVDSWLEEHEGVVEVRKDSA